MYRYVCENLIPGCTYEAEDPDPEKLRERVSAHLREHHELDERDERVAKALKTFYIRPA